jgi:hypothetical protein
MVFSPFAVRETRPTLSDGGKRGLNRLVADDEASAGNFAMLPDLLQRRHADRLAQTMGRDHRFPVASQGWLQYCEARKLCKLRP